MAASPGRRRRRRVCDSAVLWAHGAGSGALRFQLGKQWREVPVDESSNYSGKTLFHGLRPNRLYHYRVSFRAAATADFGPASQGEFRTAPDAQQPSPLRFAWGGDLAGQNVCRDQAEGFPALRAIDAMPLDFFVGLGDMIYADNTCEAVGLFGNAQVKGDFGPAADMADFWAHWRYARQDPVYRRLQAKLPYYAVWDDHEVVNDFGPLQDTRQQEPYTPGKHLMPLGLKAFLDYNPIAELPHTPQRLYRNIRWGKQVELFFLDTRQYRDANAAQDSPQQPKSLLGREQLAWLKASLKASDAVWKIIVTSVPLSIPTGFPEGNGRDGWAHYDQSTGFSNELSDIIGFMHQNAIGNSLWLTTDVHFAAAFRYTPYADDPDFKIHEIVSGPLNAGLFPNDKFDPAFGAERLFFYGPKDSGAVKTWDEAKLWLNYGSVAVDERGR